ncbi:MAG: Rieske (2Fe-2S) protein, partial [Acidimicrobiales bacterium]
MGISAEERKIIRSILDQNEQDATQMLGQVMDNPVTKYTDPEQLQQEMDILFRNFPIVIAHSSELADVGDFLTHDDTGVPLLVTRSEQGDIKAFLNVCRHRGARIEGEPCGHARRFTCPYHAWTYGLDGGLRGMPQPVGFDSVDRSEHGLVELPAFERFGLIWVVPSPQDGAVDLDAWLAPMEEQFDGLGKLEHAQLSRF